MLKYFAFLLIPFISFSANVVTKNYDLLDKNDNVVTNVNFSGLTTPVDVTNIANYVVSSGSSTTDTVARAIATNALSVATNANGRVDVIISNGVEYSTWSKYSSNSISSVSVTGPQSNLIAMALQVESDTLASVAARGDFDGTETIRPRSVEPPFDEESGYSAIFNSAGVSVWDTDFNTRVSPFGFFHYFTTGEVTVVQQWRLDPLKSRPGGFYSFAATSDVAPKLDRSGGTATNLSADVTFTMFGYTWTWNTEFHTFDVELDGGVTGQLFQEQHVYAKNMTGAPLLEGRAVCVRGAVGDNVLVGYADASDPTCRWTTIGLVTQAGGIANGGFGYICTFGNVNDINTSAFQVSNTLWLASNGTITNVEPVITATGSKIKIGTVLRAHATQGRVFVNVAVVPNWTDVGAVDANTVGFVNTTLHDGSLNSTNGVYFKRNGTNYWILLY